MAKKEMITPEEGMRILRKAAAEGAARANSLSREERTKQGLEAGRKYFSSIGLSDAVVHEEEGFLTSARRFWQKLASYEETSPNKPKEKKKPPKRKLTREEWEEKLFEKFQREGPPNSEVIIPSLRRKNWGFIVHHLLETDGAGVKWKFPCGCRYERRQKGKSIEDFLSSCSGSDCQNPNSVFYRGK